MASTLQATNKGFNMFNERRLINLAAYVYDSRCSLIAGITSTFFIVDDFGQLQIVNDQYWREVLNRAQSNFA